MPRAATSKSLPGAFRMMKAMQAQGIEWGEGYQLAGGAALKAVIEGRMVAGIDRHLAAMAGRGRHPRDLFADILRRIDRLRPKPSPA